MFLEHKTLATTADKFFYYVLCVVDGDGCHPVGYFSKEKTASSCNLNCILVFPFGQGGGYGKLLIDMSYVLSMLE